VKTLPEFHEQEEADCVSVGLNLLSLCTKNISEKKMDGVPGDVERMGNLNKI